MAKLCPPVILLAGITGNYLRDTYPIPPDVVWSALTKDFTRLQLHPDNIRYEAQQPSRVLPDQPIEIVYRELVEELRHNLSLQADKPVPVYVLAYDWRQPLEAIEDQLHGFIDEVIERTKLLRHYDADGYAADPKVNLVGHSMGGLIIAGYLARHAGAHRVAKLATIATPFRGSVEAVAKMTSGLSNLTGGKPSSREREASRVTPGLYYLLPAFAGCLADAAGQPLAGSLFDATLWQDSVLDTLKEYIRLYGLKKQDRPGQAAALFKALLDAAAAHHAHLESFRLGDAGLVADDWLCIAGVDRNTRVRLKVEKLGAAHQFTLDASCAANGWHDGADAEARWNTGDGTVPLRSAVPPFLAAENLVCLRPGDFGFSELGDSAISNEHLVGFHASLPNMDLVHRLIVRHFLGQRDRRSNTWGRPAPGVTQWQPPISLDAP